MSMTKAAEEIVARLGLKPHPEGGFFTESFRSPIRLTLPDGRIRSASTAIYFMLPAGSFSAFHKVSSDEVWHFYEGNPLELTTITPEGMLDRVTLGRSFAEGQRPQYVASAGVWQAAVPVDGEYGYTLVGCTVAPGFDFADFEMPERAVLEALFPQHGTVIHALTRD